MKTYIFVVNFKHCVFSFFFLFSLILMDYWKKISLPTDETTAGGADESDNNDLASFFCTHLLLS